MATQQQLPGKEFVNETATFQQQIPGGPFMNETVAPPAGGRTTKNTRAAPLGVEIGMDWRSHF